MAQGRQATQEAALGDHFFVFWRIEILLSGQQGRDPPRRVEGPQRGADDHHSQVGGRLTRFENRLLGIDSNP